MCRETKIVILGGDLRFSALAQSLRGKYNVSCFQSIREISSPFIQSCDFLVLPLPCTSGNSTVLNSSPDTNLKDIFPLLNKNALVLAGKVPDNLYSLAKQQQVNIYDYYTDEFETLNAIPSAEGAIEIAMNQTDFTLCGSKAAVLGFGRIGKTLAKMLSGIGAKVTVCARRKESLALARALGFKVQSLYNLSPCLRNTDIVFNTIPSLILDQTNLLNIKKDTLIIDLASKPGGVDFKCAEELGLKTIHALGLPVKTSPKTSSEILVDSICSLIEERRTNGT